MMTDLIAQTLSNLERHRMSGYYVESIPKLHHLVKSLLHTGERIGCGDSATLEETRIFDLLRQGDYQFLDKHQPGLGRQEKRDIYLQNFSCDTFVTGINAVTADGKLFNIDGNGRRVAPILYGPEQVIAVAGTNKLVRNVDEAIRRARQIAAPLDAARLEKGTPCTKLGTCVDCQHPNRICNDFVLITGQFTAGRIKVILIQGDYGF